jgi:hypothetical protein
LSINVANNITVDGIIRPISQLRDRQTGRKCLDMAYDHESEEPKEPEELENLTEPKRVTALKETLTHMKKPKEMLERMRTKFHITRKKLW